MIASRASAVQAAIRLLITAAVVGGILPVSTAAGPDPQGSPADKLRYGPGVANHPVGVVPSAGIKIPAGWPLNADGTISCLTCHEQLPPLQGARRAYLRDFDDDLMDADDFCMKCHAAGGERSAAAMHWMAVRTAHLMPDAEQLSPSGAGGPGLDAHSRRCMACHDGVSASDADNTTPWNRGRGYLGDKQRNHPVGVRYPSRPPRDFAVRFRPVALLPRNVCLPGGRVSCISCHDIYAESRSLLTVPIERSALCLTCHDLD